MTPRKREPVPITPEQLAAVGEFLPHVPYLAVVDEVIKQRVNRDRLRILVARNLAESGAGDGYAALADYLETHPDE